VAQFGEGKLELREERRLAPPRNTLATKAPPGLRICPATPNAASASAASTNCAANTKRIWQVTGGFWCDVYKGDFGRLRVGGQGSYTERQVFAGIGGPNTNEGIFMASLRYYPFAP
jgi:hypothetical protein